MNDEQQLTFLDITSELTLKERLEKIIYDVCQKQNVNVKYIKFEKVSDGYSVWICEPIDFKETSRAFNIKYKNTARTKRYDVSISYKRIYNIDIPKDAELIIKEVKHKDENGDIYYEKKATVRFPLTSENIFNYLRAVFDLQLSKFEPSEKFGCCGKYLECSDAKECLYKDKFYARACYYKSNLEAGRIFYGKNATNDVTTHFADVNKISD